MVLYKTVSENIADENILYAPVAQLDRVFGYEPKGRGFESLIARHVGMDFVSIRFFYFMKKSVIRSVIPPFRKKARSAHLFACKRAL